VSDGEVQGRSTADVQVERLKWWRAESGKYGRSVTDAAGKEEEADGGKVHAPALCTVALDPV
jgi:hypothetical protein